MCHTKIKMNWESQSWKHMLNISLAQIKRISNWHWDHVRISNYFGNLLKWFYKELGIKMDGRDIYLKCSKKLHYRTARQNDKIGKAITGTFHEEIKIIKLIKIIDQN